MENYIDALQNISYKEWIKLKTAIDRVFEMKKSEIEKNIKLANAEEVKLVIQSQFG